jgi:hypothetical protein
MSRYEADISVFVVSFVSSSTSVYRDRQLYGWRKRSTRNQSPASYLDIHLEIDSDAVEEGNFTTKEICFQFSHYELSIYM